MKKKKQQSERLNADNTDKLGLVLLALMFLTLAAALSRETLLQTVALTVVAVVFGILAVLIGGLSDRR